TEGFSQGERVKTAIGCALVHDPRNVILDEPTNGLDVMATRRMRTLIRGFKGSGRSVLFSSHIMQEVAALCDRIVVIAKGQDVVLRIGKDYGEQWRKGEPAPVELIYDQSQRDTRTPRDRAKDLLQDYNREVGLLRLLARGVHPVLASPVVVVERDQSTALSRA